MRKHPWLVFFGYIPSTVLGTIISHPFIAPRTPLWIGLACDAILYVPCFLLWYHWLRLARIFRRLPHAVGLGIFAWQQQAAVDREQWEALSQEKFQRMYGLEDNYQRIDRLQALLRGEKPKTVQMPRPASFDEQMQTMAANLAAIGSAAGTPIQEALRMMSWPVPPVEIEKVVIMETETKPFELTTTEAGCARFEAAYAQAGQALETLVQVIPAHRMRTEEGKVLYLRRYDGKMQAERFYALDEALLQAFHDFTRNRWAPLEIWDFGCRCVYDRAYILRYVFWAVQDHARELRQEIERQLAEVS